MTDKEKRPRAFWFILFGAVLLNLFAAMLGVFVIIDGANTTPTTFKCLSIVGLTGAILTWAFLKFYVSPSIFDRRGR